MDKENKELKNSLPFPFIGSLENGEPFEYLLISYNDNVVEIAIVDWLVNRTILHNGDKINVYIPSQSDLYKQLVKNLLGTVVSSEKNESMHGIIYKVSISEKKIGNSNKNYSLDEFVKDFQSTASHFRLITYLIKDSALLKEGVAIYLNHLIPFFSRIINYEYDDYLKLKESILIDILNHVRKHQSKLNEIHATVETKLTNDNDIAIYISLDTLREIMESEISVNLFDIIFNDKSNVQLSSKTRIQSNYSITMYIDAIKNLEKRVYANYNSIVILYLISLKRSPSKLAAS